MVECVVVVCIENVYIKRKFGKSSFDVYIFSITTIL